MPAAGSHEPQRFFFVHVMKTAGATLRRHIRANFKRFEVYPSKKAETDLRRANFRLDYLTSLPPGRRRRIRAYTGHFPFVAVEMLDLELTTLTVLRDPVERTLSYLRHCQRYNDQHRSLAMEEIYEDPYHFPCFIHNHQAKLFALTVEDEPDTYMDVLEVDAQRLELAKANLERVDVLGLQDRFEELLGELEARFGWDIGPVPDLHVSDGSDPSAGFRRRIAEDNAADVEFYEHAVELYERRRAGASRV